MVTFLYKWSLLLLPFSTGLHPFHVSTTEISHNAVDRTLEVSCRVFTDDFETAITGELHQKTDFSGGAAKKTMDELVNKYLSNHLSIGVNGKPVTLNYVGWEKENEAVYVYFQVDGVAAVSQVTVNDSILFNLFDDQISIIHVKVNGNRKSTKLTYPEKTATLQF